MSDKIIPFNSLYPKRHKIEIPFDYIPFKVNFEVNFKANSEAEAMDLLRSKYSEADIVDAVHDSFANNYCYVSTILLYTRRFRILKNDHSITNDVLDHLKTMSPSDLAKGGFITSCPKEVFLDTEKCAEESSRNVFGVPMEFDIRGFIRWHNKNKEEIEL